MASLEVDLNLYVSLHASLQNANVAARRHSSRIGIYQWCPPHVALMGPEIVQPKRRAAKEHSISIAPMSRAIEVFKGLIIPGLPRMCKDVA